MKCLLVLAVFKFCRLVNRANGELMAWALRESDRLDEEEREKGKR